VIWGGVSRRTVFILGAGATRGAFPFVRVNGKKIVAPLNGDFFKVVKAYVRAHKENGGATARYDRIRKVFREEFPTRGKWPIPMEDAFSLLYVSKDFPEIYGGRGRQRKAGTRQEIDDFLSLTFGILSDIELRAPDTNLYKDLVSSLEPDDTIVTLNYDTLLDSALINAGWDPATGYGLMGGSQKIKWTKRKPVVASALARVKLLKLHGSLNWYVRGSTKNLSGVFAAKPSKVIVSSKPRANEFKNFVRQIIPPIFGKFFGHKHWRTLWKAAYEALVESEVLVVVGCSLVDSDFHLTGMLSNALMKRKRSQSPFWTVAAVDRGLKTRRKWLALVKGCAKTRIHYRSFLHFADRHLKK
jgi:SIR2-like domain